MANPISDVMEFSPPRILEDKERLKEIYNLRTLSYDRSFKSEYVNNRVFPDGWKDNLDEQAVHWVVETGGKIVASARLVILNDLAETGEDILTFDLPSDRPYAYYSRLVVHPDYRGSGIGKSLDTVRIRYIIEEPIAFAIAFSFADRTNSLIKLGFKKLGTVNYKWCGLPLPPTLQHFFIFEK